MIIKGWAEGLSRRGRRGTGVAHMVEQWAGHGFVDTIACADVPFGPIVATAEQAAPATCGKCAKRLAMQHNARRAA